MKTVCNNKALKSQNEHCGFSQKPNYANSLTNPWGCVFFIYIFGSYSHLSVYPVEMRILVSESVGCIGCYINFSVNLFVVVSQINFTGLQNQFPLTLFLAFYFWWRPFRRLVRSMRERWCVLSSIRCIALRRAVHRSIQLNSPREKLL